MLTVSVLEPVPCQASVAVNCVPVMSPDRCSIHYTPCCTSPWERTFVPLTNLTVAASPLVCIAAHVDHLPVVLVNTGLQVGHASVADFHSISVQDLAEGVIFWEIFRDYV